jgi:hypothetical protein
MLVHEDFDPSRLSPLLLETLKHAMETASLQHDPQEEAYNIFDRGSNSLAEMKGAVSGLEPDSNV